MRSRPPRNEKPLHWVGSSKRDLLAFPERVVDNIGYALGVVQYGGYPPSAKAWKGLGPGVSEIVEDDAAGTFRAVYAVRFSKAIYVLHAFQKKSPSGIRPRDEMSSSSRSGSKRRNWTTRRAMARKKRIEVQRAAATSLPIWAIQTPKTAA